LTGGEAHGIFNRAIWPSGSAGNDFSGTFRVASIQIIKVLAKGRQQVARITCPCGHVAELAAELLRGLVGRALRAKLKGTQCGARHASVSIRWQCPPKVDGMPWQ
jgi:hypothetical protein